MNQGSSDFFFGRYSIPVGMSVVLREGVYTTVPYPSLMELDGLEDGTDYFLGGHEYVVSDEVAAALTAAGYEVS